MSRASKYHEGPGKAGHIKVTQNLKEKCCLCFYRSLCCFPPLSLSPQVQVCGAVFQVACPGRQLRRFGLRAGPTAGPCSDLFGWSSLVGTRCSLCWDSSKGVQSFSHPGLRVRIICDCNPPTSWLSHSARPVSSPEAWLSHPAPLVTCLLCAYWATEALWRRCLSPHSCREPLKTVG